MSQPVNSANPMGKMPVLSNPGPIKPVARKLPAPPTGSSEGRSSPTLASKTITPLPKNPPTAASQELLAACQKGLLEPFIAAFPPDNRKQLEEFGFIYALEAAKHNQMKLLQWLIQAAPALLTPTFAIDVAEKAPLKITLFVLQSIDDDDSREDPEGYYFEKLVEARKEGNTEDQVVYLIKIGELYFKGKNWPQTLRLLNGALSVLLENHSAAINLAEHLFSRLGEAESQFFAAKNLQLPPNRIQTIKNIRQSLKQIREECAEAAKKQVFVQEIQKSLTAKFMGVLATLIDDAQKIVGKPPETWACFAMGSAGREEMCPRSDIECAFIIKDGKPATLDYFRKVAEILEIWLINCGETPYPIFGRVDPFHPSPTPGGFAFDSAGNTPLGVKGVYELIGTPKMLAQFISMQWMERNIILPNALTAVIRVAGDQKLVDEYNKEKEKALDARGKKEPKIREVLAYRLLEGHLQEFRPELTQEKAKGHAFGIKKELYRPFQEILGCLALLFKLKEKNTFKRIDELVQLKKISAKGGENLKKAVELVLMLRVDAHLFYKDEQEYICHREQGKWHEKGNTFALNQMLTTNPALKAILPPSSRRAAEFKDPQMRYFLYFDPPTVAAVEQIYRVLMPFHRCAEEYFHTKNEAVLASQDFCDEEMLVRACMLEKSFQPKEALQIYQQIVAINPNDPKGLIPLSRLEAELGNPREALGKARQAYEILEKKHGFQHPHVAQSNDNIGDIYYELGEYAKALEHYTYALRYWLHVCDGEEPLYLAKRFNNIAACQHHLRQYQASINNNEKALKIRKGAFGEENEVVAQSYQALGCNYKDVGNKEKALDYFQKAYRIALATGGSQCLLLAVISSNLGLFFETEDQYQKAFLHHNKALKIRMTQLGEEHPETALTYHNLGAVYGHMGQFQTAMQYFQKAQKIFIKVYAENHQHVAVSYKSMGDIFEKCGQLQQAYNHYAKALEISKKVCGEKDPFVAQCLNGIGCCLEKAQKFQEALTHYQQALDIEKAALGEEHSDTIVTMANIASLYYTTQQYQKGLDLHLKVLSIKLKIYDENHSSIAISYNNISAGYRGLKNMTKAMEYNEKALAIKIKTHGENHPSLATSYFNIGSTLADMNDLAKAMNYFKKAILIWCETFQKPHPNIQQGLNCLLGCAQALNNANSKQILKEIYPTAKKILGPQDTFVQGIEQMTK